MNLQTESKLTFYCKPLELEYSFGAQLKDLILTVKRFAVHIHSQMEEINFVLVFSDMEKKSQIIFSGVNSIFFSVDRK